jgi:hypothetical protein
MELKLLIDGLKLPGRIITGYNGNEDRLAMRRNEIDGTVGSQSSYQEFVENGYGRFIAQIGGNDKDVLQLDLRRYGGGKALVASFSPRAIFRLTAGPPGIPRPARSPPRRL